MQSMYLNHMFDNFDTRGGRAPWTVRKNKRRVSADVDFLHIVTSILEEARGTEISLSLLRKKCNEKANIELSTS